MHLLGFHASIQGGYLTAVREAGELHASVIQIFTQNQRQWKARKVSQEEGNEFQNACRESAIQQVVSHAIYLLNLGSVEPSIFNRSVQALKAEIERCAMLGIPWVVVHPGAHRGAGEATGWNQVRKALREILEWKEQYAWKVGILLENTAGQGTSLGASLENLLKVVQEFSPKDVGICLDTCHLWAAGYEFASERGWRDLMILLERHNMLERIRVWHMNNSKHPAGSRKDRHAHISEGTIPLVGFWRVLHAFPDVPAILETPRTGDWDRWNLAILRILANAPQWSERIVQEVRQFISSVV